MSDYVKSVSRIMTRQGGTIESVPNSGHKDATDRGYGPWAVVTQKKNGTRNQKSGGASVAQDYVQS